MTEPRSSPAFERSPDVSGAIDQVAATALRIKRERDDLEQGLKRCADTLRDLRRHHLAVGRPLLAQACHVAENDAREILARVQS